MEFILNRTSSEDMRGFVKYIISLVQEYGKTHLSVLQCSRWNKYYKLLLNLQIDVQNIILMGFKALIFDTFRDRYVIHIDYNKKYQGYNIYKICSSVNDGVISCMAYPIFDEAFKFVKDNIQTIFTAYLLTKGK